MSENSPRVSGMAFVGGNATGANPERAAPGERDLQGEIEGLAAYIDGLGLLADQRLVLKATVAMILDEAQKQARARLSGWRARSSVERRQGNGYPIRSGEGINRSHPNMDARRGPRRADDLLYELRALIGVGTGHHAHWDHTMQHGAGCEECKRAREAGERAREIIATLRARLSGGGETLGYVVVGRERRTSDVVGLASVRVFVTPEEAQQRADTYLADLSEGTQGYTYTVARLTPIEGDTRRTPEGDTRTGGSET